VIDLDSSWEGLGKNESGTHVKQQVSPDKYETDYTLSAKMLDSMASLVMHGLMS
jgi:thiamine pyrophosphokinase